MGAVASAEICLFEDFRVDRRTGVLFQRDQRGVFMPVALGRRAFDILCLLARPPAAGKGRPKGAKNKFGNDIKNMIIAALETAGGVEYLARQAEQNPAAFIGLISKILPLQIGDESDSRPVKASHATMSPLEAYRELIGYNSSPRRLRHASR